MEPTSHRSRLAMIAAALVLAADVVVPLAWGDVYPFTSAPMFRDAPVRFCDYRVIASDGRELPRADWLVQRIYDGNPVGYGVGLRPPRVLEQEFGVIHDEVMVREHIQSQFAKPENGQFKFVEVVQETIGPVDSARVGTVRTERWRIARR